MKKAFFTLTMIVFNFIIYAQDHIILKNGDEIKSKILEITATEIRFKKAEDLKDTTYTIYKSEVYMIKFENGDKIVFTETPEKPDTQQTPERKSHPKKTKKYILYKNRIGLNIGGGIGFKSVPVVKLENGSESSISFGGGGLAKFEYGHEFNEHFDLAIDFGQQFSQLQTTISNGSMTFNRSFISLTPSYVLPIGKRKRMRLRFGAGIDWLFDADLDFDLSKIPNGFKDDWKYKDAFGDHLSLNFEIKTPGRISFDAGLKLQNVKYAFKSGDSTYPIQDDLKNPIGSGIDFYLGIFYNFNWRKQMIE